MKKFSFGKATLLVFMILAAGAVLAMPASAAEDSKPMGTCMVYVSGNWISSSHDQFQTLGKGWTVGGEKERWMEAELTVTNTRISFGPFREHQSNTPRVSTGIQTYQDSQDQHRSHTFKSKLTTYSGENDFVRVTLPI
jgi:hypothetical protein